MKYYQVMNNKEIENKLNTIIANEFNIDTSLVNSESIVSEAFDFDSLDHVTLLLLIEDCFDIKVKTEEFIKINTVGSLCKLIAGSQIVARKI